MRRPTGLPPRRRGPRRPTICPDSATSARRRPAARNDGNELGRPRRRLRPGLRGRRPSATTPILRRFAIQQRHITWGASPFAAIPRLGPAVFTTATEDFLPRRVAPRVPPATARPATTRAAPHRERESLALRPAQPRPGASRSGRSCCGRGDERVGHLRHLRDDTGRSPLAAGRAPQAAADAAGGRRAQRHRRARPDSRDPAIGIDLGTVISARAALDYDQTRWLGDDAGRAARHRRTDAVVVEYAAHPRADSTSPPAPDASLGRRSRRATRDAPAAQPLRIEPIAAADRPVRAARRRPGDRGSRSPCASTCTARPASTCRRAGTTARSTPTGSRTTTASSSTAATSTAYVPGECVVDLPLGRVSVEISRGYEIAPVRTDGRGHAGDRRADLRAGAAAATGASAAGSPPTPTSTSSARRRRCWKARPRASTSSTCWPASGARCSATSATSTAGRRSAPAISAATASSWSGSAPRTGCRCSATSPCSATPGR